MKTLSCSSLLLTVAGLVHGYKIDGVTCNTEKTNAIHAGILEMQEMATHASAALSSAISSGHTRDLVWYVFTAANAFLGKDALGPVKSLFDVVAAQNVDDENSFKGVTFVCDDRSAVEEITRDPGKKIDRKVWRIASVNLQLDDPPDCDNENMDAYTMQHEISDDQFIIICNHVFDKQRVHKEDGPFAPGLSIRAYHDQDLVGKLRLENYCLLPCVLQHEVTHLALDKIQVEDLDPNSGSDDPGDDDEVATGAVLCNLLRQKHPSLTSQNADSYAMTALAIYLNKQYWTQGTGNDVDYYVGARDANQPLDQPAGLDMT